MVHQLLAVLAALSLLSFTPQASAAEAESAPPQTYDETLTVRLLDGGEVHELSLQEYLIGVVLQEMPASFEEEALKAQAVAARTVALYSLYESSKHEDADICGESSCCQCYMDEPEGLEAYGETYEASRARVREAVLETDGQVLTYDGELIVAAYFSSADARTESAKTVWGGEIAYLRSVSSPEEVRVTEAAFSPEEIRLAFPEAAPDGAPDTWFGEVTETEGGGVAQMEIGGKLFSGTEIRARLSLRSSHFTVSASDDSVVFSVSGSGHGVGMSQYGANALAAAGERYDAILLHYYSGAKLQQLY